MPHVLIMRPIHDDAIALLEQMPDPRSSVVDTSMQTDAYDPDELSLWMSSDADADDGAEGGDGRADEPPAESAATFEGVRGTDDAEQIDGREAGDDMLPGFASDDTSTAPIVLPQAAARTVDHDIDEVEEAERASRAAFQRWTSSSSE